MSVARPSSYSSTHIRVSFHDEGYIEGSNGGQRTHHDRKTEANAQCTSSSALSCTVGTENHVHPHSMADTDEVVCKKAFKLNTDY
jgi:hypothetical protein